MGKNREAKQKDYTERNTYVIMISTLISRILGIVRISIISMIFGASGTADVINFTFNIPNNLRKLLAEGALSSAYIPVLSKSLLNDAKTNENNSQLLVQNMLGLQLMILIPLILGVFLFDEQIIRAISSFSDPSQIDLSSDMLTYFSIYLLFISLAAVISATLHCKSVFIITAFAPLSFSIAVIGTLLFFGRDQDPLSFVVGVLIGGLLQLIILVPAFKREGFIVLPTLRDRSPHMRQVLKYWLPVMITSSIAIINQQVAYFLASGLPQGSVTSFSNAIIFWQLPYGLFFNAIATVYFPKMSRDFYKDDMTSLESHMHKGLNQLMLFIIPSMFILLLLSDEFVAAILLRGQYTLENTYLTGKVVRMYTYGLLSLSCYNFLLRFFYSIGQYKVTLISSIIVACSDILLSVIYVGAGYDVSYLALANSISFTLGVVFLLLHIRFKTSFNMHLQKSFKSLTFIVLLCIPAVFLSFLFKSYMGIPISSSGSIKGITITLINSGLFGVIILLFYRIGNVDITWIQKKRLS